MRHVTVEIFSRLISVFISDIVRNRKKPGDDLG